MAVRHHLRRSRRARGEEGEHRLGRCRRRHLSPLESVRRGPARRVEMHPAGPLIAEHEQQLEARAARANGFDFRGVVGRDDGDARASVFDAIGDVLRRQQVGAGHRNDAALDAADYDIEEDRAPRHHHQCVISLTRAEREQRARDAIRATIEVRIAEPFDVTHRAVDRDHRGLVGDPRALGHDVEPEVEARGDVESKRLAAGLVICHFRQREHAKQAAGSELWSRARAGLRPGGSREFARGGTSVGPDATYGERALEKQSRERQSVRSAPYRNGHRRPGGVAVNERPDAWPGR